MVQDIFVDDSPSSPAPVAAWWTADVDHDPPTSVSSTEGWIGAVLTDSDANGMVQIISDATPSNVEAPSPTLEEQERFRAACERWRNETAGRATITQRAMHPAYQEIIGLGKPAIPLILDELSHELDDWFWALKAITLADPVPPKDRGAMARMRDWWLEWGREQGFRKA